MKGKRMILGVAALSVALSYGAMAGEIYKRTDANGNVVYEDRPSGSPTEERLAMTYNRTDSSAVQGRVKSRHDRQSERQEANAAAASAEEADAAEKARAEEVKKYCEGYRAQLETLALERRVYRTGPDGERVYLDDAERDEAKQKAEALIAEHCNS